MNKQDWLECLLFAGFRLLATALFLLGATGLVYQFLDAWYRFDPNYLAAFLLGTLLWPGLMLLAATALHLASARLARRMAARFADSGS